jgi:hypothetical protein
MQSLETVFLLIALSRYPHALCTCASAIESVIKAAPVGAALGRNGRLEVLIKATRRHSVDFATFPEEQLKQFRQARNRFTHHGFSPRDDSEAVSLLIQVGFPFLGLCYQHLHSFDLWDSLLQEYVYQLKVATKVFQRAERIAGLDRAYCIRSLGHLIQWSVKDSFSAYWELKQLAEAAETLDNFDFKDEHRSKLERLYGAYWNCNCPLCGYPEAVVCELDEDKLNSRSVNPLRMACTNCGFVVGKSQPFLSETLLEDQIVRAKEQVLKEYGL